MSLSATMQLLQDWNSGGQYATTDMLQKLYQTTMWPLAAINQARGFVSNSISSYRNVMNQIFSTSVTSATLATVIPLAALSALQVEPVTSRGVAGRCSIQIPVGQIPVGQLH